MGIINLGILAHVDAGKTSLTERILFEVDVIDSVGSVDRGNTQTDTLELERQRGITIQSTVVSFPLGGHKINLIDTPGHADFIAEVERSLSVLDGVILVISAVEGVQPQTRRLARAIRSLDLPLVVFINKIDRLGARPAELTAEIRRALGLRLLPLNEVRSPGGPDCHVVDCDRRRPEVLADFADVLAENSDAIIASALSGDGRPDRALIERELQRQAQTGLVVPAFFGSARTGAGVRELLAQLPDLLPQAAHDGTGPASAVVFKIQRTTTGEKLVFARMFAGTLHVRDHVALTRPSEGIPEAIRGRITGLDLFQAGTVVPSRSGESGDIVRLHGLAEAWIGDVIGRPPPRRSGALFDRPALESVVRPVDASQATALNAALLQLGEQDPLIDVGLDGLDHELRLRLYGEVQKEVIAATLSNEFGLDVEFEASRVICIETPIGTGQAIEAIGASGNPFAATVALLVEPASAGRGVSFQRPSGALPLAFYRAIEETVYATLGRGLFGWAVTDCAVQLTETAYSAPVTVAADFRNLTPLVLMDALRRAGTVVREPVERFTLEGPSDCVSDFLDALHLAEAVAEATDQTEDQCRIIGQIPTRCVYAFEQRIPGLSRGEGVFVSDPDGYAPVRGVPPVRSRRDANPLNRKQYLALVSQR